MTAWISKLTKRLCSLPRGRYMIVLTVGDQSDWTVQELGPVER